MGTMVPFSDDTIEADDESLGLGTERMAELNEHGEGGIPRTALNLREVLEADARAPCDIGLSQPERVSDFAHPCAEHKSYPPGTRIVRHGRIVRRSLVVACARYPSTNVREDT